MATQAYIIQCTEKLKESAELLKEIYTVFSLECESNEGGVNPGNEIVWNEVANEVHKIATLSESLCKEMNSEIP